MARISLFSTEYLFNEYDFQKTHIALIVDTCGIGAKFSNMFFGTRFDENGILSEDIWSGFSYSGSLATIVLLFRVNDTESICNAIKSHAILNEEKNDDDDEDNVIKKLKAEKKKINPTIFLCKKDGIKFSIYLSFNLEIIVNGIGSKNDSQNHEITFIGNSNFMSQVYNLRNNYDFSDNDDNCSLPNIIDNSRNALKIAKMIIAGYLTFHTFDHYHLETIEKCSIDTKPYIRNIAELFDQDNNDD